MEFDVDYLRSYDKLHSKSIYWYKNVHDILSERIKNNLIGGSKFDIDTISVYTYRKQDQEKTHQHINSAHLDQEFSGEHITRGRGQLEVKEKWR